MQQRRVEPVVGDFADLARHALAGEIKVAREAESPAPQAVLGAIVDNRGDHASGAASLIGHSAGDTAEIMVDAVPELLERWDGFVGMDLVPSQ